MTAIPGMTKEEVEEVILRVIKRYRGYAFDIYDADDIENECYFICLDGLKRYDPKYKNLENFLSVHVRNRIINFVNRKNNNKSAKFLINSAIPFDRVDDENESSMRYTSTMEEDLMYEELLESINDKVPVEYRMDFLKLMRGIKISKIRKDRIAQIVQEHLQTERDFQNEE